MLKKTKPSLLLTLGAAVLLIGGGIAAYSLLVQRHLFLNNAPLGSQLVPQDALITASISTNPTQWRQLGQYGTPETQAAFNQQLTQLQAEFLTANGYNYEQDVQPWLGESMIIAYFGGSSATGTVQRQDTSPKLPFVKSPDLMVLPIENPAQAQQLLEKAKSQTVTQFGERTYKGVQIRETQKRNGPNHSAAVLGNFFVVTNNPKTIERVIDTYKGGASIASIPGYSDKLSQISTSNAFAQVFLNMPAWAADAAAKSKRSLSPENLAAKQQRQGVATTVTLESEGIRLQGISWLKPDSERTYPVQNTPSRLPRRLPANTLLMLSGGNLAQLWLDYVQGADANPLIPISPASVSAGLQARLGVNVEEDLLPWMGGEFALALVPASEERLVLPDSQLSPTLGAGLVFMILSSDRSQTEESLQQLDQVMETQYQFTVEKTQINGQPAVNWISPLGGVSATHGWLEGNIVFLTLGAPIARAIVPQPQATLTQTPGFQQTVPTRPNPNNGQFFLDVERTINRGTLNLSQYLPPEPKMWVQAISGLGVTAAIKDERSTRYDLFVQLKKTLTPSPAGEPETIVPPQSTPLETPTPQTPASPSP